jgi:hypothetical protein
MAAESILYVRLEVFTAVTMQNGVFWDVTPCGSCNIPENTIPYTVRFMQHPWHDHSLTV